MLNLSETSPGTGPFGHFGVNDQWHFRFTQKGPEKGLAELPLAGTFFPLQGVHKSCVHKILYQEKVSILQKAARGIAFFVQCSLVRTKQ